MNLKNDQNGKIKFDLEKRTLKFSSGIIDFTRQIRENNINNPIINQLIRAATSVGANYCEANNAQSKKDFAHKIAICKKEARESEYWLTLTQKIAPELSEKNDTLKKEARELTFIFAKIIISCRKSNIQKL
jgi:four helix bundle protein